MIDVVADSIFGCCLYVATGIRFARPICKQPIRQPRSESSVGRALLNRNTPQAAIVANLNTSNSEPGARETEI